MNKSVKMGFESQGVVIPINKILPLKKIKPQTKKTKKYHQISASVREVGIVEHLIVCPQKGNAGNYMLLDGHIRLEVLKEIGERKVSCLISKDDEGFTYNHKVNRLSTIQEHFMILKAIEKGVSEVRIAKALNVNVAKIREKRNLLRGICPEVVELLQSKHISPNAFRALRKMKATRQIEAAELMIATNNYTVPYTQALLAATPKNQLIEQRKAKKITGLSKEGLAQMEKEAHVVEKDFRIIKDTYGKDILNLVLASGYITKLLSNDRVVGYLSKNHTDILSEFNRITKAVSAEI